MSRTKTLFVWQLAAIFVALVPNQSRAAEPAEHPVMRSAESWLRAQLASLGEKASYELSTPASLKQLAECAKISAELPEGNRLQGRTFIRVRCTKGANWLVLVPAVIHITTDYWISSRILPPNHTVTESDIQLRSGDVSTLPPSFISDAAQAIGKVTLGGEPAGAPLRADHLRAPWLVRANETVKIRSNSSTFEVTSEGRALNSASLGQSVTVRTASGSTISGIVQGERLVEVGN